MQSQQMAQSPAETTFIWWQCDFCVRFGQALGDSCRNKLLPFFLVNVMGEGGKELWLLFEDVICEQVGINSVDQFALQQAHT